MGKLWSWRRGLPPRHQSLAFAEWKFLRQFRRDDSPAIILNIEDHWPLLTLPEFSAGAPRRLVGVIHYPPELWTAPMLQALRGLRSALVLYRADIPFFERHVGAGRVAFAPHGVDLTHFAPAAAPTDAGVRLLVSGQFGRDFELLARAYPRIREHAPDCRLDLVGAHHARHEPAVRALARQPNVHVHPLLADRAVLDCYRHATLVLHPLRAAGANNALVEALACGLPVLATDVGGVRDYGGGTVFPLTPAGDDAAFAQAAITLLAQPQRRAEIARAGREFAARELSWATSARVHLDRLAQLTASAPSA
jgi:glycosyltransferase involved in cell wall biosynthesis